MAKGTALTDVAPDETESAPVEKSSPQYRAVTVRMPVELFDRVEAHRWDARIDKRADAFTTVLLAGADSLGI